MIQYKTIQYNGVENHSSPLLKIVAFSESHTNIEMKKRKRKIDGRLKSELLRKRVRMNSEIVLDRIKK